MFEPEIATSRIKFLFIFMTSNQPTNDLPDRIVLANNLPALTKADYVLVILNRALRGEDNPVIDAAIVRANELNLGIVVYSELDETVAYASDRLFYFALGAFRELAKSLAAKNIKCVQVIRKEGKADVLKSLIANAAEIYTDEEYTHWDKVKSDRLLEAAIQTVYFVDASRLVPTRVLPKDLKTTPEFRKAHGALRNKYAQLRKVTVNIATQVITVAEHNFSRYDDAALKEAVAKCNINHDIKISAEHPPTQAEITARIDTLKTNILAKYKWIRNNPALEYSTSQLSPYIHFGMISPHQLLKEIESANVPKSYTWKFRDEFLTWREWSHYLAFHNPKLHQYDSLPEKPRQTLAEHAKDERPDLKSFEDIINGNTADSTWNAAQKEWLNTGWLHNNLRMYWSKQILRYTKTPQAAWDTACYLNDYISLDGRDPATYASMQWAFGNAKPGYSEKEIYGWVAPKSDRTILKREGMKEWIAARK